MEVCPQSMVVLSWICEVLKCGIGAALVIDYDGSETPGNLNDYDLKIKVTLYGLIHNIMLYP